eukprot:3301680-Karenia_brevis.AAC.1
MLYNTRRVQQFVDDQKNGWTLPVRKLATAALIICRLKLTEITLREHVQLVWIILGDRLIRAHEGCVYYYDEELRAWQLYVGMLPESVFDECRGFMMKLEGLFRSLEGNVQRGDASLLEAI